MSSTQIEKQSEISNKSNQSTTDKTAIQSSNVKSNQITFQSIIEDLKLTKSKIKEEAYLSFRKKIDKLNIKFYIETERYLKNKSNQSQTEKHQEFLFLILFKQISLYNEEVERLYNDSMTVSNSNNINDRCTCYYSYENDSNVNVSEIYNNKDLLYRENMFLRQEIENLNKQVKEIKESNELKEGREKLIIDSHDETYVNSTNNLNTYISNNNNIKNINVSNSLNINKSKDKIISLNDTNLTNLTQNPTIKDSNNIYIPQLSLNNFHKKNQKSHQNQHSSQIQISSITEYFIANQDELVIKDNKVNSKKRNYSDNDQNINLNMNLNKKEGKKESLSSVGANIVVSSSLTSSSKKNNSSSNGNSNVISNGKNLKIGKLKLVTNTCKLLYIYDIYKYIYVVESQFQNQAMRSPKNNSNNNPSQSSQNNKEEPIDDVLLSLYKYFENEQLEINEIENSLMKIKSIDNLKLPFGNSNNSLSNIEGKESKTKAEGLIKKKYQILNSVTIDLINTNNSNTNNSNPGKSIGSNNERSKSKKGK